MHNPNRSPQSISWFSNRLISACGRSTTGLKSVVSHKLYFSRYYFEEFWAWVTWVASPCAVEVLLCFPITFIDKILNHLLEGGSHTEGMKSPFFSQRLTAPIRTSIVFGAVVTNHNLSIIWCIGISKPAPTHYRNSMCGRCNGAITSKCLISSSHQVGLLLFYQLLNNKDW